MKIDIYKPTNNKFFDDFTLEERKFIEILQDDRYFESKILEIRKRFCIPNNGFSLNTPITTKKQLFQILYKPKSPSRKMAIKNFKDKSDIYQEFRKKLSNKYDKNGNLLAHFILFTNIYKLLSKYKLNMYRWETPMMSYVIYNKLIPSNKINKGLKIITGNEIYKWQNQKKAKLPPRLKFHDNNIYIKLTSKFPTKTQFVDAIKKIWPKIQVINKESDNVTSLPKIKVYMSTISMGKKILKIRNGGTSFPKITDMINANSQNKTYGDEEIRSMYTRYNKYIKGLRSESKS